MEQKTPDYSFKNGIETMRNSYNNGAVVDSENTNTSRSELLNLEKPTNNVDFSKNVAEQMSSTYVSKIGKVAIEFALLGPKDSSDIIISRYGWGGDTRNPVAVYEAQALAAQNPNSQIMYINTPGAGQSSALPDSMSREISRTGSFLPYGELVAQATNSVVEGKKVQMRGHSLGARTAIAQVPFMNPKVESLIVNDPVGSENLGVIALAKSFIGKEGQHFGNYLNANFDQEVTKWQKESGKDSIKNMLNLVSNGSFWQQMVRDPLALSRNGLEGDLAMAAPNVESLIRILSPELSELNKWENIAEIIGRISLLTDTKIQHEIIKNHTHSWTIYPTIESYLYSENR